MSRIGKREITVPQGVTITLDGDTLRVKGPKGELSRILRDNVTVTIVGDKVQCAPKKEDPFSMALWGTYASHVLNMIEGVVKGFEKKLQIEGVGYRVEAAGKSLKFQLGYSHPIIVAIPDGIEAVLEKNLITIKGYDKEAVGQFAANIIKLRKPEPYKGKGVRYEGQVVPLKQGKKSVA